MVNIDHENVDSYEYRNQFRKEKKPLNFQKNLSHPAKFERFAIVFISMKSDARFVL